jgi:nitrite reductase/ring-hydroxylating ferredoxin subunit
MRHELFGVDELQPGEMRSVMVDRVAVVVVRTADGSFRALRDRCPHQGVKLSLGKLEPIVVGDDVDRYEVTEDLLVRCPWHGYEFAVDSGRCLADPDHSRVRAYKVEVEGDTVVLER